MNILYLNFSLCTGGIEKLLVDIVNTAVKEKKHKIYLCLINNQYDQYLLDSINPNVKIILFDRKEKSSKLKYIIKFIKFILNEKIDVIHCQSINSLKFSLLCKIVKPKIKIFITVHASTIYPKMKKYEVLMEELICKKIIAISDVVKKQILSRVKHKDKVIRIYNGININKFINDNQKKVLDKNLIIIGNVARLVPSIKGQDVLIKAIGKLKNEYPNINCLLAGDPYENNEKTKEELLSICTKYDIEENVTFMGNINDIPNFLKKLDIFVLPSRSEGLGISLIEAMASGVPCIASDVDGPKELIKDNKYGILFECGNYLDLADKVKSLINEEKKVNKKEVLEYIKINFDIKNMVKSLFLEYES